jgi:hypothetical protein
LSAVEQPSRDDPEMPTPPVPPIVPPSDRVNVRLERGEYVFDFDVPLPRKKGGPRGSALGPPVPFNRIPNGSSYFAQRAKPGTVSSAAAAFCKRNPGVEFFTAFVEVDVKYPKLGPGVRIWRLR